MIGRKIHGSPHRPRRARACLTAWLGCCTLALASLATTAEVAAETVSQASTSNQDQAEATSAIPFQRMTPEMQAVLRPIVEDPSLYRRMPTERIECDPDLYLLMVRYPEIVVNIWHLMEITNVQLERTGDFSLQADDGAGTTTNLELVYGTRDLHVLFSRGLYEGPLFRRPIAGDCVLLLRTNYQPGQNGRVEVTSTLDVFVKVDHAGASVLARTLQPLLGRTADINFTESIGFLGRINEAAEESPEGIQSLAMRLEDVEPGVRDTFAILAGRVAENTAARHQAQQAAQQGHGTQAIPASLGVAAP